MDSWLLLLEEQQTQWMHSIPWRDRWPIQWCHKSNSLRTPVCRETTIYFPQEVMTIYRVHNSKWRSSKAAQTVDQYLACLPPFIVIFDSEPGHSLIVWFDLIDTWFSTVIYQTLPGLVYRET